MEFSTPRWKEQAKEKYREIGQWLGRRTQEAGQVAYGTLSMLTLWPLVEYTAAAAQTGQPVWPAMMALGSVASGVGSNLLASQIQNWYEAARKGQAPTEADVQSWLAQNVQSQPELQTAVDHMLQQLEAIDNAQAVLPAETWQSFARQLAAEMAQMGNLARFEAKLIGSGAIAQGDGAVAVGERGIYVGGSVGGDINTGDHIIDPEKMDPQALRHAYLSRLLAERNQLLLGGIDPQVATAESERLQLSAVYTALLTETSEGAHFPGI